MKEDKSILRTIKEAKFHLRYIYYDLCASLGIFKLLYPNIKQPYKKWYENKDS